tara:strand:+ start:344 stop:742 length:399 start_codon:yes stop_codon:yes gene_type:complete
MATELNLDTSEEINVITKRGDSLSFDITVKDTAGAAVDLTVYTFDFDVVSGTPNKSRSNVVLSNSVGGKNKLLASVTGAGDGTLTVSATREAMANISPGTYRYDISANHNTNSTTETFFFGTFTVREDITIR